MTFEALSGFQTIEDGLFPSGNFYTGVSTGNTDTSGFLRGMHPEIKRLPIPHSIPITKDHELRFQELMDFSDYDSAIGLCIIKIQTEVSIKTMRILKSRRKSKIYPNFNNIETPEAVKWREKLSRAESLRQKKRLELLARLGNFKSSC